MAVKGKKRAKKSDEEATEKKKSKKRESKYTPIDVEDIVEKLQGGTTMTEIRGEYGSGPKIRKALTEAGFNTKGEEIKLEKITGKGAALAKRVAAKRKEGVAWYTLALMTGMSESDLKELLTEHGFEDLVEGRVSKPKEEKKKGKKGSAKSKAKAAKEEEADEDEDDEDYDDEDDEDEDDDDEE